MREWRWLVANVINPISLVMLGCGRPCAAAAWAWPSEARRSKLSAVEAAVGGKGIGNSGAESGAQGGIGFVAKGEETFAFEEQVEVALPAGRIVRGQEDAVWLA